MEVMDVYAVTEPGGPVEALMLFDAGNERASNLAVRVLPQHSSYAQPALFVTETGPGIQIVNVISGHEFIPGVVRSHSGPTDADYSALEQRHREILVPLSEAEQSLYGPSGSLDDALSMRRQLLLALDTDWPGTIWVEELLVIGHRLLGTMVSAGTYAEAQPLSNRLRQEQIGRRWVGDGGPNRHFGASEARGTMQFVGEVDAALRSQQHADAPSSTPPTPEASSKKRGFWRR